MRRVTTINSSVPPQLSARGVVTVITNASTLTVDGRTIVFFPLNPPTYSQLNPLTSDYKFTSTDADGGQHWDLECEFIDIQSTNFTFHQYFKISALQSGAIIGESWPHGIANYLYKSF